MNKLTCALVVGIVAALVSSSSFAAVDMFLKLKGAIAVVAKATVAADGSFRFDNVADGEYVLEFWMDGKTYTMENDQGSGPATAAVGGEGASIRVVAAREAASGLATGRRMHKPIRLTRDWGPSSPKLELSVEGFTITGRLVQATTPGAQG
jgi:hypothetical protein